MKKTNKSLNELSHDIDLHHIPTHLEKEQFAEVSTPYFLRKDMLDSIPSSFWKNPLNRVFEPSSGKGGFLIDIIKYFMIGLKNKIKDEKKRYQHIVENQLYFADINEDNIKTNIKIINQYQKYKLNYYVGDSLKTNIVKYFGIDGFECVIGNPPYNDDSGIKGKGHSIWTYFVEKALDEWLLKDGYLLYVHPSLWRQYQHPLFEKMKKYHIIYLEIHNVEDGIKTFKCSTRYDWYLLQKKKLKNNMITKIKTEDGKIYNIHLNEWDFIPNKMLNELKKITNKKDKIKIIHSESLYDVRKNYMSHTKTKKYNKPCIYSINKEDIPSLKWSSEDKGHFGIPKFIFSNGAGFIVDDKGKYGLTQWASAIEDNPSNLKKIYKAFTSDKFKKIKEAIQIDSSTFNTKILRLFNHDFWKEFI